MFNFIKFKKETQAEKEAKAAAKAASKAKKKAKRKQRRRKKNANLDEHQFNQFYGDPDSTGKKLIGKRIGKEKSLRPCDANFQW